MVLMWPYMECHHVLNLLVARIQPWLDMVEWGQLKAKGEGLSLRVTECLLVCAGRHTAVFPEEEQADYDFALGGDMTADAFTRAVQGPRGGAAPMPHTSASGPGDAPSSAVQPVADQPFPEGASSLVQGTRMSWLCCKTLHRLSPLVLPVEVWCASFVS